jgi:hypothetical protein
MNPFKLLVLIALLAGCATVTDPPSPAQELGERTWRECQSVDSQAQIRSITAAGRVTFYTTNAARVGAMERCLDETYARLQREWLTGKAPGVQP